MPMDKPPNRGRLIVFEGLDRSGKSTQCARLVERLQQRGQKVEQLRFPDRTTPIGLMINNYLSGQSQQEDHVIHLLFSANRWERAQTIEDLISTGTTVVVDRYYYSGCVYSAAKQNPTLDLAWCRQADVGLPRPDLCLFLDIAAEEAARRGGFGAERYEKQEMQDRVRDLFATLRTHQDEAEDIRIIDAGRSVEQVEQSVQEVVHAMTDAAVGQTSELRRIRPW
nr:isoform 2 of thymidylate kinase [Quercus suber]